MGILEIILLISSLIGVCTAFILGIIFGQSKVIKKGLCGDVYLGDEGLHVAFDSEDILKDSCLYSKYLIFRNCTNDKFFYDCTGE